MKKLTVREQRTRLAIVARKIEALGVKAVVHKDETKRLGVLVFGHGERDDLFYALKPAVLRTARLQDFFAMCAAARANGVEA